MRIKWSSIIQIKHVKSFTFIRTSFIFQHFQFFICYRVFIFSFISLALFSYLNAHIFPIFRVNDTIPSLKMNVDGRGNESIPWPLVLCFNAFINWVHDNKSKWNFYLTNHKRLRFIGAEKYSRQAKRHANTYTKQPRIWLVFAHLSWFMFKFNIVFLIPTRIFCMLMRCCQHTIELPSTFETWILLATVFTLSLAQAQHYIEQPKPARERKK